MITLRIITLAILPVPVILLYAALLLVPAMAPLLGYKRAWYWMLWMYVFVQMGWTLLLKYTLISP